MTSMPRLRGVTEFQPIIQPTMGIKWNSGSLLDMEAHMPGATQNNSKKNKKKQPRKEEYP